MAGGRGRGRTRLLASWKLAVAISTWLLAAVLASSAMGANEYEQNDNRDTAYGPLAGGVAYTATFETENDEDWYLFYVKTYSQLDFSATSIGSGCAASWSSMDLLDLDGEFIDTFNPGGLNETNHLRLTLNPGRYYLAIGDYEDKCTTDRYRFRIDPAASLTTSRECGEAIVARDAIAPALATVNEELAENRAELAVRAAAVHEAKKALRQASRKARRLNQKVKRLAEHSRIDRRLNRARGELRRVRGEVVNATERLDEAKAKRRPVWQEKRNLESVAGQHQQAKAAAEGQIATYC